MLVDEGNDDNVVDGVRSQDVVDLMLRAVNDDIGVLDGPVEIG